MIIKKKHFLVGGSCSPLSKDSIHAEAPGFRSECLRAVDGVLSMLEYMRYSPEREKILDHIFKVFKVSSLPDAPESWSKIEIPVLRLYGLIKNCHKKGAFRVDGLTTQITMDETYINIKDTHESGDNR